MKKLYIALFLLAAFMLLQIGRTRVKKLKCCEDIEILKENIKSVTNADTVIIYTKRLREEIFFPIIRSPVIIIENATTNTLDFKTLPIDKHKDFGSSLQVNDMLQSEAEYIAKMVVQNCNMKSYNDLIIEFIKRDDFGNPMYRFICHYADLLNSSKKQ